MIPDVSAENGTTHFQKTNLNLCRFWKPIWAKLTAKFSSETSINVHQTANNVHPRRVIWSSSPDGVKIFSVSSGQALGYTELPIQ
jgi:hypothetical protein